jgi:trehalose/maltose hydrolase-like predicted phosphorylase
MAGTVDQVLRVSTGIEVKGDVLLFNPELPPEMECLESRIRYRGHSLDLRLTHTSLTVCGEEDLHVAPIALSVAGKTYDYISGTTRVFELNDGGKQPALSKG